MSATQLAIESTPSPVSDFMHQIHAMLNRQDDRLTVCFGEITHDIEQLDHFTESLHRQICELKAAVKSMEAHLAECPLDPMPEPAPPIPSAPPVPILLPAVTAAEIRRLLKAYEKSTQRPSKRTRK